LKEKHEDFEAEATI